MIVSIHIFSFFFFFFSSRRRHTRLQGDWSSDVCSSDLNLTRCIPLVLAVLWVHLRPASVDAVALLTGHRGSDGVIGLVPHLDGEFRVGKQIVVPVGIGWRPPFGGEDEQAVVFAQVHQRAGEAPTALGACGREQKQRLAFPYAADLSSIRPERLNRLAIPIISVRHICSFLKKWMPTRSAFLLRARLVLCHSIPSQHMTSSNLHMYPSARLAHEQWACFSRASGRGWYGCQRPLSPLKEVSLAMQS